MTGGRTANGANSPAVPRPTATRKIAPHSQFGVSEAQWLPAAVGSDAESTIPCRQTSVVLGIDVDGSRAASAVIAVTRELRVAEVQRLPRRRAVLEVTAAVEEIATGVRSSKRHTILGGSL